MAFSQNDLFEIFSWLPAKAIYRCKSVCKSISNFSNENIFQIKQYQNMLMKCDTCFFIQLDTAQRYNEQIELHPLPGEQLSSGVASDILEFLSNSTRILDSSNGLILCRTTYKNPVELFICNPATQFWLPIPLPEHLQKDPETNLKIMLEFGHGSPDLDDYKVILFEDPIDWDWESPLYFVCNVFHPRDGVWKTMEKRFFTGPGTMKFHMHVQHGGYLHFISDCIPYFRPYIMSYNLENGVSSMLCVPEDARSNFHDLSCEMNIFKWGNLSSSVPQSICLVRLSKSVFTIWVLEDYESSLWYKIMEVRLEAMGWKEKSPKVSGFIVMNGDALIFSIDKKVYSYGLIGEKFMKLEVMCEHRCDSIVYFTPYSNTLRPCGTGATTLPLHDSYTISHPGEENVTVASPLKVVPS